MTFGVWMLAPDGPAAGGLIRPIAEANASMFGQMHLKDLKGSATYEGQAAGYYATRAAGSAEAASGRFTATATLEANFDVSSSTRPADSSGGTVDTTRTGLQPMARDMNHGALVGDNNSAAARYYRPVVLAPGVSFVGSKIDKFMTEDGTMMEGWVVNLNGGVLRRAGDVMVVDGDTTPGLSDDDRQNAF